MLDQPVSALQGQTHGPTVAGALEDFSSEAVMDMAARGKGGESMEGDGEPMEGLMEEEEGASSEAAYPRRPVGGGMPPK